MKTGWPNYGRKKALIQPSATTNPCIMPSGTVCKIRFQQDWFRIGKNGQALDFLRMGRNLKTGAPVSNRQKNSG